MTLKINWQLLLISIVVIAFFTRFYRVEQSPPALNWDEASIGYNAYSILKTGSDEWGKFMPLHFKSYGEYKLPVQIYGSIPGIAAFGLNELGVRITPIIYGTLTVLILFFLASSLFNSRIVGLLSAFLLAVSPWHVQLTRASFESSFSLFWVLLGMLFLVKGFKDYKWVIFSIIPFVISIYTYNSARVFTPLFLAITLLIYHKFFLSHKKVVLISLVLFIVLMLPLMPFFFSGEGLTRYRLVSITDEAGLVPRIEEYRNNSNLPSVLEKLIYNRPVFISFYFVENYLSHFSPQFLFTSGAGHVQHHVQGLGELYYFQFPFLIIGLLILFTSANRFKWFLLCWVLIAFIPVSTTNDSIPNALRTVIAAPFYQILTALGIVKSFGFLKAKNKYFFILSIVIYWLVVLLSINNFFYNLLYVYPVKYSRDWQYGYKSVVKFINQNDKFYDQIVITPDYGQPYMFVLFYSKYDPSKFQRERVERMQGEQFIDVLAFGKYKFQNSLELNTDRKILYVNNKDLNNTIKIEQINFLDDKPAFIISQNK